MNIELEDYDLIEIDYIEDGKIERVYDIEIDSIDHAFIAKSEDGAIGISHNSALISLSDLSDDRSRHAKSGQWWVSNGQRALANNSAVYTEKPDIGIFMDEWKALYDSKSGERGIFNRQAAKKHMDKLGRRNSDFSFGVNPCSEILLRPNGQLCNLSEVVIRAEDTIDDITQKIKWATILGTWQSTLTNFKYVSKKWKENCEEERLLGVSLTGIMDNKHTNGSEGMGILYNYLDLIDFKKAAIDTNIEYAEKLGINPSVAITTIKPSGTVSQLVDSASGIHARHNPYYIRTVRADKKDPLAKMMVDLGFPVESDVMKPDNTYVFSFPIKAPENAIFRKDITAIDQLNVWLVYRNYWTEHNPSITVSVKEDEWLEVGAWVYRNFDSMTGVSFLPYEDHSYRQAPFQDCTKEEYEEFLNRMPKNVDWSLLQSYEMVDSTVAQQTLACTGSSCEL